MATERALEKAIQNEIRLAVGSLPDVRLWRNNVGEIADRRGVSVKYGLAVGSADTIGIVAPHGRLLSIEVKRPGYKPSGKDQLERELSQQDWRDIVNRMGGIAIRCDSVEQALFGVVLARHYNLNSLPDGTVFPAYLTVGRETWWESMIRDWELRKPKAKR